VTAAELIRSARLRHGISQASLARRCRTSQTQISRIERAEVSPSVDTLDRLLQVMGQRLELRAEPGPRGNRSEGDARADAELSASECLEQAAELSYALTAIASAR